MDGNWVVEALLGIVRKAIHTKMVLVRGCFDFQPKEIETKRCSGDTN